MLPKICLATILVGCGLGFHSDGFPAGQQSAAQERAKEPHRVQGEIPFSYSYEETLSLARKNGRPIFAYFTFET